MIFPGTYPAVFTGEVKLVVTAPPMMSFKPVWKVFRRCDLYESACSPTELDLGAEGLDMDVVDSI